MDEPLSNLDAALRVQTRAEILKLQRRLSTTTIYVTHDQVEAMTMGDRIAVMKQGVLQQVGTPEELYTTPTNVFVARFIGSPAMNLVPAALIEGAAARDSSRASGPSTCRLGNGRADAAHFDAQVEVVEYLGDEQLVHLAASDTPLLAKLPVEQRIDAGRGATVHDRRADKLHLFDAETELAVRRLRAPRRRKVPSTAPKIACATTSWPKTRGLRSSGGQRRCDDRGGAVDDRHRRPERDALELRQR